MYSDTLVYDRERERELPPPPVGIDFIKDAFDQTANVPEPTKALRGIYAETVESVLAEITDSLNTLDGGRSQLTPGMLREGSYMDAETVRRFRDLPTDLRYQVDSLCQHKCSRLASEGSSVFLQPLPEGLLDKPPFIWQQDYQDCTPAIFSMIFAGLTGHKVEPRDIVRAASASGFIFSESNPYMHVGIGHLLDILQTPIFQSRFGIESRRVPIYGADFAQVKDVVERIRSRRPDAKVYLVVDIGSQMGYGIMHNVIVLKSDDSTVTVHDPSLIKGRHEKEFPIDRFAALWMRGYMRGNLVVGLNVGQDLA